MRWYRNLLALEKNNTFEKETNLGLTTIPKVSNSMAPTESKDIMNDASDQQTKREHGFGDPTF